MLVPELYPADMRAVPEVVRPRGSRCIRHLAIVDDHVDLVSAARITICGGRCFGKATETELAGGIGQGGAHFLREYPGAVGS